MGQVVSVVVAGAVGVQEWYFKGMFLPHIHQNIPY